MRSDESLGMAFGRDISIKERKKADRPPNSDIYVYLRDGYIFIASLGRRFCSFRHTVHGAANPRFFSTYSEVLLFQCQSTNYFRV